MTERSCYTQIPGRSLLAVEGKDTAKFLQGLMTNHMPLLSSNDSLLYTSFLTAQGRMITDSFLYRQSEDKYVLEVPEGMEQVVLKHLKRYVLRSKVKMRLATDEYSLWYSNRVPLGSLDPRLPGFGYRALLPAGQDPGQQLGGIERVSSEEYSVHRILHGLPEGTEDIWPEVSLPLESNLDYMHGVDFQKGCYIGQELTIRTHHTGVVRKRLLPVQLLKDQESPDQLTLDRSLSFPSLAQTEIKTVEGTTKRAVGKMGSSIYNLGLALVRLEHVELFKKTKVPLVLKDHPIYLAPFLPAWWPENHQ